MVRRPVRKGSRAVAAFASRPTPVPSTVATPISSAYPSTYASEAEPDFEDEVSKLTLDALTLTDPAEREATELVKLEEAKLAAKKKQPFRFMDLPVELRIKVLGYYFEGVGNVIDLDADNYRRIHKKLGILRTCRALYYEGSEYFYSRHTFRLFPTRGGRFSKKKKPLLARLTKRQRGWITSLELRLGPGWNKPPRGWVVNKALGLEDCIKLRKLTVFVECDPSDNVFNGFRAADGLYETFSRELLDNVLRGLPSLDRIHFDAFPSVKKSGPMMRGLFEVTCAHGRSIRWGPERGWTDHWQDEEVEPEAHPVNNSPIGMPMPLLMGAPMSLVAVA